MTRDIRNRAVLIGFGVFVLGCGAVLWLEDWALRSVGL